jgi:hypothetical protein
VGSSTAAQPVRVLRVIPESARLLIRHFVPLALLGVVVFVPVGLVEALSVDVADFEGFTGLSAVVASVAAILIIAIQLVGEVVYSGMVTRSVVDERRGEVHQVGEVLRTLPYLRMIAADILFVLAVAFGLVLVIVPGVLALVWFALVGPVIEVERTRVIAAFRRSRALIAGHFWRVGTLVVVVAVASAYLGELLQVGLSGAIGDSFAAEWAAGTLAGLVSAPLFALPIVVLYLALAEAPSAAPVAVATAVDRAT